MVKGLNFGLQGLILFPYPFKFYSCRAARFTTNQVIELRCSCTVSQLGLECGTILLSKLILCLKFVKLLVSLKHEAILSLDLFNVACDNAIMSMTFVNQSMELIYLILKLIATELVVVDRLTCTGTRSTQYGLVMTTKGFVTSIAIRVACICSCSKALTKGCKEFISLLSKFG